MITLQQFQLALASFLEKEVLAKMSGMYKFLGYAGMFMFQRQSEEKLATLLDHPMVKHFEIVDGKGMIDIQKLYSAANYAMSKTGKVSLMGVSFDKEALEIFLSHVTAVVPVKIVREP